VDQVLQHAAQLVRTPVEGEAVVVAVNRLGTGEEGDAV
jgi:hypothetical protein